MPASLLLMYSLSLAIGGAAYFVSRGPDGRFNAFFFSFALITAVYVALAWVTRHQPIWLHIGAHTLLFGGMVALGMAPKPRLDEMAGMLYLFVPGAVIGMIVLACLVRFMGRWF